MNNYNKFMDKIEVTDEMRKRILKNISSADIHPKKQNFFIRYRSWIAAAACLAIIAIGAFTVVRLGDQNIVSPSQAEGSQSDPSTENNVIGWWDITECGSVDELSQAVGFTVTIPDELPFSYDSADYYATGDNMADITWRAGEDRVAWFRQKKASGDISGDCTSYKDERTLEISGAEVIASGDGELIRKAYWNYGEMAYSLNIDGGITEQQLTAFVSAVTGAR